MVVKCVLSSIHSLSMMSMTAVENSGSISMLLVRLAKRRMNSSVFSRNPSSLIVITMHCNVPTSSPSENAIVVLMAM